MFKDLPIEAMAYEVPFDQVGVEIAHLEGRSISSAIGGFVIGS